MSQVFCKAEDVGSWRDELCLVVTSSRSSMPGIHLTCLGWSLASGAAGWFLWSSCLEQGSVNVSLQVLYDEVECRWIFIISLRGQDRFLHDIHKWVRLTEDAEEGFYSRLETECVSCKFRVYNLYQDTCQTAKHPFIAWLAKRKTVWLRQSDARVPSKRAATHEGRTGLESKARLEIPLSWGHLGTFGM
jgi:hypothetical protein